MTHIYILTIVDTADFDKQLHQSAFTTEADAAAYAEHVELPRLQAIAGDEWAHAIEASIEELPIIK